MKVFLSYSHQDKAFVDRLHTRLVQERVPVWRDRIELKVGDSLVDRIETAITEAGYLAVVLSKASVRSSWCKKELTAGLVRELSERRVIVLPVLMEECKIPLFLQDKLYADFRPSFKNGVQALLKVVAAETSTHIGRRKGSGYETDFAYDNFLRGAVFGATLHAVSMSRGEPFSVLSEVEFLGGADLSLRYSAAAAAGLADVVANEPLGPCSAILDRNEQHLTLTDDRWHGLTLALGPAHRPALIVSIRCRRLGEATGNSVLFHYGSVLGGALRLLESRRRPLSSAEESALAALPGWLPASKPDASARTVKRSARPKKSK